MSKYVAFNVNHQEEIIRDYNTWLSSLKFDKKVTYLTSSTGLKEVQIEKIISNVEPYKILHTRLDNEVEYKTLFVGNNESILVDGLLTSGYIGGGTGIFAGVLKRISVDEEIINEYVYSKDAYSHDTVITILKIES